MRTHGKVTRWGSTSNETGLFRCTAAQLSVQGPSLQRGWRDENSGAHNV
jgi:hypothetical protein